MEKKKRYVEFLHVDFMPTITGYLEKNGIQYKLGEIDIENFQEIEIFMDDLQVIEFSDFLDILDGNS